MATTTEEFPESPLELLHMILDSFQATIDNFWENVDLLKTKALEMDQTQMAIFAALVAILLTQGWSKIVSLSLFSSHLLFYFKYLLTMDRAKLEARKRLAISTRLGFRCQRASRTLTWRRRNRCN
jgi:hypothetical protein